MCGGEPKRDECWCEGCITDMKKDAYEEGRKDGIKEAEKAN